MNERERETVRQAVAVLFLMGYRQTRYSPTLKWACKM